MEGGKKKKKVYLIREPLKAPGLSIKKKAVKWQLYRVHDGQEHGEVGGRGTWGEGGRNVR